MKQVAILGSTGSIGTQSLDVIRRNPDRFRVGVLSCGRNVELLERQISEFHPQIAVTAREEEALTLQKALRESGNAGAGNRTEVLWGQEGLKTAASSNACDLVLNALLGISGLAPTMAAVEAGKDIALANKETLVTGGALVMDAVRKAGVRLLPVDSEHSAIFQCLEGNQGRKIRKILLTASGGPFRGWSRKQLESVTLEQALHHPKWSMGKKITIDSATMMNKGLEVIEARWLFDVPVDAIQILVHPQSIVHSMVEFKDGSVLAQLGNPDMRIPISLALGYPDRLESGEAELDFFDAGSRLTFERPDPEVFRCITLACSASRAGGSYPVALNGANEVLVDLFLHGKIRFIEIQEYLERILDAHVPEYHLTLEKILQIDQEVRQTAAQIARKVG